MLSAKRLFLLAALLLFASTAAVVVWQNSRLTVLWDLSYVLENASRMALGQRPYRDFPFPYAPLTFLVQAAIIRLMGRAAWHHALYAATAGGMATVSAFALARRLLNIEGREEVIVAALLASPLALLGIYCILPHPFYDPDTCLAVLLLLLALTARQREPAREPRRAVALRSLMLGAASVIPLFVKQNIGLAFLIGMAGAASVVWLRSRFSGGKPATGAMEILPSAFLGGIALGSGLASLVVSGVFGLANYIQWTIRFAVARRLPPLRDQLDLYASPLVWAALGIVGAGAALARRRGRLESWSRIAGGLLMAVPWLYLGTLFVTTDDPDEWEIALLMLWPLVMLLTLVATLAGIRRRGLTMETLLPLVVLATIHGVFLSQSTWGSTYGIWPLLVVLLAFVIGAAGLPRPAALIVASVVSVVMLAVGAAYIGESHRLIYAKVDEGEPFQSSLPALRGLTMRGRWLPDFEELVHYAEREIPRDAAILSMPGEDLFYFATGRVPRFPVLMFDRTINPYSPAEVAALADGRGVGWIIVKRNLQVNGQPMPELSQTLALLTPRFRLARRLANYDVYKRSGSPVK